MGVTQTIDLNQYTITGIIELPNLPIKNKAIIEIKSIPNSSANYFGLYSIVALTSCGVNCANNNGKKMDQKINFLIFFFNMKTYYLAPIDT